jgi:hypothetical protein
MNMFGSKASQKLTTIFLAVAAGCSAMAGDIAAQAMDMANPANPASPVNIAMQVSNAMATQGVGAEISPLYAAVAVAGTLAAAGGMTLLARRFA